MILIFNKIWAVLAILFVATMCFVTLSFGTDANRKDSEIIVKAKEIRLNQHENAVFFEGDVKLLDGNYNISAQSTKIIFMGDLPNIIVANGNPANLDLEAEKEVGKVQCEGDIIQYKIGSDNIYLFGKSLVKGARNKYFGAPDSCIAFNAISGTVSACKARLHFYYP